MFGIILAESSHLGAGFAVYAGCAVREQLYPC